MTGSASSVVGQHPITDKGFIYNNPYEWVDPKFIMKPNEKAKLFAEKACWNLIRKYDSDIALSSTS
jgi:hypothetical protein